MHIWSERKTQHTQTHKKTYTWTPTSIWKDEAMEKKMYTQNTTLSKWSLKTRCQVWNVLRCVCVCVRWRTCCLPWIRWSRNWRWWKPSCHQLSSHWQRRKVTWPPCEPRGGSTWRRSWRWSKNRKTHVLLLLFMLTLTGENLVGRLSCLQRHTADKTHSRTISLITPVCHYLTAGPKSIVLKETYCAFSFSPLL